MKKEKVKRSYRSSTREESVQRTREAILNAAVEAFTREPYDLVSVAKIAETANVSRQTVTRLYTTKELLFEAAIRAAITDTRATRESVGPTSDIAVALRGLIAGYERWGDSTLAILRQEDRVPIVATLVAEGRAGHHAWIECVFAQQLVGLRGIQRTKYLAKLTAITDVCVWKVIRKDFGLDADATADAMISAVLAVVRACE